MGSAKRSEKHLPKPKGRPPKNVRYVTIEKIKTMEFIRKVDPLNLQSANLAESWRVFWQNYQIFATAAEVDKKPENVKIAIFLNATGPEAVEIYNSFNLTEDEKKKYDTVTQAFADFCKPKKNEVYESYVFHTRKQETGEPFDSFLMNIKKLVRTCGFEDERRMLRDRIVLGVADKQLQKKLIETENLTLDKAIDMGRSAEVAKSQMEKLQQGISTLNMVKSVPNQRIFNNKTNTNFNHNFRQKVDSNKTQKYAHEYKNQQIERCKYCLQSHNVRKCPAHGSTCRNCGKKNHYAVACRTKLHQVRELRDMNFTTRGNTNNSTDDELFINVIGKTDINENKVWVENIKIGNKIVKFKLDSGADINVLPNETFQLLGHTNLEKIEAKIQAYGGATLETVGKAKFKCIIRNQAKELEFAIVKNGTTPILGLETCVELNLIKRIDTLSQNSNKEKFLKENADLFEGVGTFVTNFNIELKEGNNPVAKPARRIPLSIREAVKAELDRLEKLGIIEKSDNPANWISNIVIVEKPGKKVRICLDPKELNEALKPVNHPIPTFQEISAKLANKSYFTTLDLKDGYFQIELNEATSELCTFSTPFGSYKYKRLPFGIRTAPEIFQKHNEKNFMDIEGASVYIDDIFIAAENEKEHDEILNKVIERARKLNIKFNKNKVQYKVNTVRFLGHIISQEGISCDPDRVKAIQSLTPPQNKKELQQLFGLINYVRTFIPHLSEISAPLRELLKKNSCFKWEQLHTSCLERIKTDIAKAPTLKIFNETKEIVIQADASKHGLGACMLQENRPIYFASRSLSETEINYSQIEKELLSIVFACHKFHYFIYGRAFKVITDHKPLLGVFNKDITKIPNPRLQRMLLRLSKYNIKIEHSPGKYMYIADLLSRNFIRDKVQPEISDLNSMIHSINVGESKKKKFVEETIKDDSLSLLKTVLENGWPTQKSTLPEKIKYFWKMKNNLLLDEGIIFLNERILVPVSMRQEILDTLHKSHQGIEKTKNRARSLIYWPGIDQDIENIIGRCQVCQKYRSSNVKEPYLPHEVPNLPFDKIGMDILEIGKELYLVVNDYFSKYIEIIPIKNKKTSEIITKLKLLFSTHGLPKTIIADNNPFGSYMFRQFCEAYDMQIITTSPNYPQANGLAERTVQTAKGLIQKARDSNEELWMSLLEFRNTPMKGSKRSPAEILMGRKQRTLLPSKISVPQDHQHYHNQIKENNRNYKAHYDKHTRPKNNFQQGERIWVKSGKIWVKGIIESKHPTPRSYWVTLTDGTTLRRNSCFLRSRK